MEQSNSPITIANYEETINYSHVLSLENGLCQAVASGDIKLLETLTTSMELNQIRPTDDKETIMWGKYSFVALTSLVLRSAIRGGLPQFVAFSISITYCSKVEQLTTQADIKALTRQMLMEYCKQVNAAKVGNTNSHIIRRCQVYIREHLHDNISMEDLAEYCRVSTRSISAHFKSELNMSVPAYITNEKLSEAKYLLSHSSYSISEVSNYLSFSSQSYFTKVFKNSFGCTPQQYRDKSAALLE